MATKAEQVAEQLAARVAGLEAERTQTAAAADVLMADLSKQREEVKRLTVVEKDLRAEIHLLKEKVASLHPEENQKLRAKIDAHDTETARLRAEIRTKPR